MGGLSRRAFMVGVAAVGLASCKSLNEARGRAGRFFFTSGGKTGMMSADGGGLRWFEFDVPGQATWQPCGFFSDGRRVLFLSMEPRRDGPGRPFAEYYHKTPTHLWIHDLESGSLVEVATRDRMAPFYTPQLLLNDDRVLIQVVRDSGGQIYSMNIDGSGAREFTHLGEGMPYGFSLSPDGRRVAYHIAGPSGYQIWTCDLDGGGRTLVAAHPERLYFAPAWSPDGSWLVFQDCRFGQDLGHDWSDISIARPDGSGLRNLTSGQSAWFAATYGPADNRGGGSNTPSWTRDGRILFSRRRPGSQVPWVYQTGRPDVDHFNREFMPEQARGGTDICRIDPSSGAVDCLTNCEPPVWDFRQTESPDGRTILFCRAETGGSPAIWVMDADGGDPRMLTRGLDDRGADHPRWLPGT